MNDRVEREIDELLARLGVGESPPPIEAPIAPTRSVGSEIRRQIPGSPVRLMLLSLLLGLSAAFLPGLPRPLLPLAAGLLVLGYVTWLCEPDPPESGQQPGWFARFYRGLYGE